MRSYAARGINVEPTVHMGKQATAMMRRGEVSEMQEAQDEARARSAEILRINPEKAIAVVEREKSVFDRRDVARVIHRFACDPVLFTSILERAMAHESVVRLAPEFRDPGTGKVFQEARNATREMVRTEHEMVRLALTLSERVGFASGEGTIATVLARFERERGFALNAEQQEAVRHVTDDKAIAAVVGLAGTGKSTMLEAARQVFEAEGHRVLGAALAGKAAAELTKSSGIEARTLASWEARWEKGRDEHKLRAGDVFVVDEAGMVSSRQLARIVAKVEEAGAKLVLVGDPQQLQPIQAGAAFRAIVEKTGYLELADIRRQKEEWQRQASVDLARGEIGKAIAAYQDHGLVESSKTIEQVYEKVVADWFAERDPAKTAVVLAYRNKDVDALNDAIREQRAARGEIAEGQTFLSVQRRTKQFDSIELMEKSIEEERELRFSAGDRVLLGKGWGELKNGLLGSVVNARPGEIDVKLDGGVAVGIKAESYPYVSHGYAMTIHKAQGVTADRSYVVASPVDDRHLAYVAMSRHREQAKLHWATDDFTHQSLIEGLSRSRAKEATTDYKVDIDAFLERRGLESRRTMADLYAAYKEQATAWISAQRERIEDLWQRFETLIGVRKVQAAQQAEQARQAVSQARQAVSAPEPLVVTTATVTDSVDREVTVPGLSKPAIAALDQVRAAPDRATSRQAISRLLADPEIAAEIAAVSDVLQNRYGPWHLRLEPVLRGAHEAMENRYGKDEAAALARHADTLRAVQLVRETADQKRQEALGYGPKAQTKAEPLVEAVREWPKTVEQIAREKAAADATHRQHLTELSADAAAIDTHIRAHARETEAAESARNFVLENAHRLGGGLAGSTKLLDPAGRRKRELAVSALGAFADKAARAAIDHASTLEREHRTEEARRRAFVVEIPELSANARSALAHLDRVQSNTGQLTKLAAEIDSSPRLKAELDAHIQAMNARFGPAYARDHAALRQNLAERDHGRVAEILWPARVLENTRMRVEVAEQSAQLKSLWQRFETGRREAEQALIPPTLAAPRNDVDYGVTVPGLSTRSLAALEQVREAAATQDDARLRKAVSRAVADPKIAWSSPASPRPSRSATVPGPPASAGI